MPGLLDFLQSPESQQWLGLLGAAGPTTDPNQSGFGARIQAGMGYARQQQDEAQKRMMVKLQFEMEMRKNQMINDELAKSGLGYGQNQGGSPQGAQSGGQGTPTGQGGTAGPAPSVSNQSNSVPRSAMLNDLIFNGGKNIGDMNFKLNAPKWENINGNLVNTNAPGFNGGFQPGMNTSANGQVTSWQPDGKGGLVVGAPAGAIDTYSAYQNAGEASKSKFSMTDVPDGKGGTIKVPTDQALRMLDGNKSQPQSSDIPLKGGWVPSAFDMARIRQNALATGNPAPAIAADSHAVAGQGFPPGKTGYTPPQSELEAQKARLVGTATADTAREATRFEDKAILAASINSFDRLATAANEAMQHPGLAGITGLRGAIPNIPGTDAANAAAQMNTLKSQVGFGVLQDMRNNSKSGGALGQISDREMPLLQGNLAALDKPQSVEQMKANLKKVIDYADSAKDRLNAAFYSKHGDGSNVPVNPNAATAQPQPTAANPTFQSFGYKTPESVIQDAQNTIMRNPSAKAEVLKRLQAMGLSLPGMPQGAGGSW